MADELLGMRSEITQIIHECVNPEDVREGLARKAVEWMRDTTIERINAVFNEAIAPLLTQPEAEELLGKIEAAMDGYANKSTEDRLRELVVCYTESADDMQRQFFMGRMQEATVDLVEHPEWFEYPCECQECMSYG